MPAYEYKVFPAPNRAVKAKGVKGTQARFAHALESLMNEAGAEGWEYLRADTLPCEERQGLRGRVEVDQHVLVFRREIQSETGALLMTDPVNPSTGADVDEFAPADRAESAEITAETHPPAGPARLGPATRNPV